MVRFLLPPPEQAPMPRWATRFRAFFLKSWPGRAILAALLILLLERLGVPLPCALDWPARCVLVLAFIVYGWRAARALMRAALFKIRTKLLLSYLFIAVVPVVLLGLFFAIAGLFFSGVVASHLLTTEIERQGERLESIGRGGIEALGDDPVGLAARTPRLGVLGPKLREVHPDASWSLLCAGQRLAGEGNAPQVLPAWWHGGNFDAVVKDRERELLRVAVSGKHDCTLFVDAPLDARLLQRLESQASIRYRMTGASGPPGRRGVSIDIKRDADAEPAQDVAQRADGSVHGTSFMAPLSRTDWATGASSNTALLFQFTPWELVRKLTPGPLNLAERLVQALAVVAVVFLLMYGVALVVGGLLARSITRSVHALSRGTQLLRQGHFEHRIPIQSRDQLGELADSFNLMATGIQDSLRQQGEKERLEEELRIARRIQMSLLPQQDVVAAGLRIAATCVPAAEVGGDYYDLLPLPEGRLGVLVADVSGKGTSAALYMAELKGVVLSLSRIYDSPGRLLSEANRILAQSLDTRSFITMIYAVVDVPKGRMRFARAGHTALVRLEAASGRTHVLTPPGLGLGMDSGTQFDRILQESEVPLEHHDAWVFFTDGLSEAMNPQAELFGEGRLRAAIEQDPSRSSEELKETILASMRTFVGGAAQHDDMTLVVLKVV
jgi:serine phosphatase RsbU (regulator of sigma subunit)